MTQKIDFVEMARKLMANKVILKISQDPERLAEVILAGHLKNAYELGWKEALASHAPSDPPCYCGHLFSQHDRGNCTSRNCACRLYDQVASEAAAQPTRSFEATVQPAMNALSLEALRDMQRHISTRIAEIEHNDH